jgi:hypothetical protein
MKKSLLFVFAVICFNGKTRAQIYSPITTTGYNVDAVAENTTALANTTGTIDGSSNVLYSAAYGQLYSPPGTGLPNNGIISAGTRTYQLQPYTQNNVLYIMALQMDSLTLSTPAPYPGLSILAFATEGAGAMDVKLRFTDGSTQVISNVSLPDWYNASPPNSMINGFDRASRPSGLPNYAGANPRMFYVDLYVTCSNRQKNIQRIVFQNTTANPRLCIMAASGAAGATVTANTSPVTCAGGNNGSATVTVTGGNPPFNYIWGTTPVQNSATVNLLPVGVTNFTVNDFAGCPITSSVTITQSLVPSAPLVVNASANPVCSGSTVTLTTSGASTYTWTGNASGASTTLAPTSSSTINVVATTSANCTLNGSFAINVNPLPALTFTSVPDKLCTNAGSIPLTASPPNGTYAGNGLSFGSFFPSLVGPSTQTLSYTYTDINGCTSTTVISTTISSPTTVIGFVVTPSVVCQTSGSIALIATPGGGTFAGQGLVGGNSFSPALAGIGTKTVSYTHTDINNCTVKKVVSISVNICTGIEKFSSASGIRCEVYPNPNNGSFVIKASTELQLLLLNELGQSVQSILLNSSNNYEAPVELLPPGIYFISAQNQALKHKIIVTAR